MKKTVIVFFMVMSCIFLQACSDSEQIIPYTSQINAMDTVAFIRVYDERYSAVADECAELMVQLESELSVTLTGSRVYHLNKNGSVPITENIEKLVEYSNDISEKTNGAFTPCIYPLVKLWGFADNANEHKIPDSLELAEARLTVSNSKLYIKDGQAFISKGAVDFGGIAKGYAATLMRDKLKAAGVDYAIVDLGGNIQTVGTKPDGKPWIIAINDPVGDGYACLLSLGETAVVTSGSDVRYFVGADGKKYHHIIDPQTGFPAETGLLSVSVIHENAAIADGLSTAFFILGVENSLAIAKSYGAEVVFIKKDEIIITSGLKDKITPDTDAEGKYKLTFLE